MRTFEQLAADAAKAKARWNVDELMLFSLLEELATECAAMRREIDELKKKQQPE